MKNKEQIVAELRSNIEYSKTKLRALNDRKNDLQEVKLLESELEVNKKALSLLESNTVEDTVEYLINKMINCVFASPCQLYALQDVICRISLGYKVEIKVLAK